MRVWYENSCIFGLSEFVSVCVERDKKNFEKMDFCSYTPAHFTQSRSVAAGAKHLLRSSAAGAFYQPRITLIARNFFVFGVA